MGSIATAPRLWVIDLETRSDPGLDLRQVGAGRYCLSAGIDCVSFVNLLGDLSEDEGDNAYGDGCDAVLSWIAENFEGERGDRFIAHNALFEYLVFAQGKHRKFADRCLRPEYWLCSMMMARYLNLPASLENLSKRLLGEGKADYGRPLLQARMAERASGQGGVFGDEGDLQKLSAYCKRDVELTVRCLRAMLPVLFGKGDFMPRLLRSRFSSENASHLKVALRGLPIDLALAENAADRIDSLLEAWNRGCVELCGSPATNRTGIRAWLQGKHKAAVPDGSVEAIVGACLETKNKEAVRVGQCFYAANSLSLRKWRTITRQVCRGRFRDHVIYCGTHTGRWSSEGVQVQNFPNPKLIRGGAAKDAAAALTADGVAEIKGLPVHCADVFKYALRRCVRAEDGNKLIVADFAQIELRILLWIAGREADLARMHQGADLYIELAQKIFRTADVEPWQRAAGKQAMLALGYGMGVSLLALRLEALAIPDPRRVAEEASATYHATYPEVKKFWSEIQSAFASGEGKGRWGEVMLRPLIDRTPALIWLLPSRRPFILWEPDRNDKTALVDSRGRKKFGYHIMAQNLTSAIARDILAEAIIRVQSRGIRVVGHVHDEIIAEVPEAKAADARVMLADECTRGLANWSDGDKLPIEVDSHVCSRWWEA